MLSYQRFVCSTCTTYTTFRSGSFIDCSDLQIDAPFDSAGPPPSNQGLRECMRRVRVVHNDPTVYMRMLGTSRLHAAAYRKHFHWTGDADVGIGISVDAGNTLSQPPLSAQLRELVPVWGHAV
jgi:hypothetical protein